jgi:hypothetical protein
MKNLIKAAALVNVLMAEKNNNGADFTVKSLKSGKEFTYAISRSNFNGKWYTHVKVETEYQNYKRLGTYFNGKIFNKRQVVDSPSAVAIAFVLNKVEQGQFEFLDKNVEVMHTGSCIRCGRTLTDSESISRGLGPTCASAV